MLNFRNWMRKLASRLGYRISWPNRKKEVVPFKPHLEALEVRLAPATNSWTGGATGSWAVAGNWSLNHAPTSGDDVVINGSVTVTDSNNVSTIGTLTVGSGATLNVNSTSEIFAQGITSPQVTVHGTINLVDSTSFGTLDLKPAPAANNAKLTGAGSIVFGANASNQLSFGSSGTNIIVSGILIHGRHGAITTDSAGVVITNNGTIQADVSDGAASGITVRWTGSTGTGSNTGLIQAISGGTLTIGGSGTPFTNTGTLKADGS